MKIRKMNKCLFSVLLVLLFVQSSIAQLAISGTVIQHNDYLLRNIVREHGKNQFDHYPQYMLTVDWKIKQWIIGASISQIRKTESVQSSDETVDCCSYNDHNSSVDATVEYIGLRISVDYEIPLNDYFSFFTGVFFHVDGMNDHDEWNHQTVHEWGSYTFDYHFTKTDNEPFVVLETQKNFVYSGVRASMRFSFFNCWIQPTIALIAFGKPRLHNNFKEKYYAEYFGVGKEKNRMYLGNELGITIGYSFKWNESN